jgi:hypothetical protein
LQVGFKIISGGQTGADRAALDWAIAHGIAHGGWCPKNRRAEDGRIPGRYRLRQTASGVYPVRTRRNVLDSDGTVVFSTRARLSGGSRLTVKLARKHQKPVLHVSKANSGSPARALRRFIREAAIRTLNVAGPRASEDPDVGTFVAAVLEKALANLRAGKGCE